MSDQPLTVDQVLDELAELGPQPLHVVFEFLADRAQRTDPPLRDAIDFKVWLNQLSEETLRRTLKAMARCRTLAPPAEQRRWS